VFGVAPNPEKRNQVRALPPKDMSTSARLLVSAASVTRVVIITDGRGVPELDA